MFRLCCCSLNCTELVSLDVNSPSVGYNGFLQVNVVGRENSLRREKQKENSSNFPLFDCELYRTAHIHRQHRH